MKRISSYLFFIVLFLLFVINIKAENVYIENISLDSKSDNTEILMEPTFSDLNINFNIKFVDVGDYAKYKVVINNKDDEDYAIEDFNDFKDSNYIKYTLTYDNDYNSLKRNSKNTVYITITYYNEVDDSLFDNVGKYSVFNNLQVSLLSSDTIVEPIIRKINGIVNNPNTEDRIFLVIGSIFIIAVFVLIVTKHKKKSFLCIIILLLIIPLSIYALDKLSINIKSNIVIAKKLNVMKSRYLEDDDPDSSRGRDFWEYSNQISSITFYNEIEELTDYYEKYDVSEEEDESVIAYLTINTSDNYCYDLHLMADGPIYANPDSSYMFARFDNLSEVSNFNYLRTDLVTDMSFMFSIFGDVSELDFSSFNTSNVTNMSCMFCSMDDFFTFGGKNLDLSSFDTSKVLDMSSMFSGLYYVSSFDLSSFDTSKVINMKEMFYRVENVSSLDLSSFDTSNVTDMSRMFGVFGWGNNSVSINFGENFDTSNVTNMSSMFQDFAANTNTFVLRLGSKFDTSNVLNMDQMFSNAGYNSSSVVLDLGENFDTTNVQSMREMFNKFGYKSSLFDLDLKNKFDTSNVLDMKRMFYGCRKIQNIYVTDLWNVDNVTDSYQMFYGCTNLPNFNSSIIDKTKANTSSTGYLTLKS